MFRGPGGNYKGNPPNHLGASAFVLLFFGGAGRILLLASKSAWDLAQVARGWSKASRKLLARPNLRLALPAPLGQSSGPCQSRGLRFRVLKITFCNGVLVPVSQRFDSTPPLPPKRFDSTPPLPPKTVHSAQSLNIQFDNRLLQLLSDSASGFWVLDQFLLLSGLFSSFLPKPPQDCQDPTKQHVPKDDAGNC